jgi:hypothetical protein
MKPILIALSLLLFFSLSGQSQSNTWYTVPQRRSKNLFKPPSPGQGTFVTVPGVGGIIGGLILIFDSNHHALKALDIYNQ